MPQRYRTLAVLAALLLMPGASRVASAPLFTLSEDGRAFLYAARPGDHPTRVAAMFGIPEEGVPAFLAANGITDATRVGEGFVYRIPNAAAERAAALEADQAALTRQLATTEARARVLEREAEEGRDAAARTAQRAAGLARLEARWPLVQLVIVLLVLATGGALAVTVRAVRRQQQAERYGRSLARELEDKRRAALAERQESGRRIVDLENRVRTLEAQLGPRVVISGRQSS